MKLCVLQVAALKLSLRDEVEKVGFQHSVAISHEERNKECVSVSPTEQKEENPQKTTFRLLQICSI